MTTTCVLVVPCFNEEERLDVARFVELSRAPDLTLLFVDDGIRMVRWGGVHTDNPAQRWTYDIDDFSWWITP